MGLVKLPECGNAENELTYYMLLVWTVSVECNGLVDKIELWDAEPYQITNKKTK